MSPSVSVRLLLGAMLIHATGVAWADETSAETSLHSETTKAGFVSGRTFGARPITYAVVGDLAVMEGDIILGTVAEVEAFSAQVALYKALAALPEENGLGFISNQSARHLRRVTFGNIDAKPERRWPKGVVPYLIQPSLPNQERITEAMKHWSERTKVRFVPREPSHKEYVYFKEEATGCATNAIGMKKGGQTIQVGGDCTKGNLIHEIGHALGLWHEHSREDRDDHITIDVTNIATGAASQFAQNTQESDDQGSYDYGSVMHYGPKAFALDKSKDSITPKVLGAVIGQRVGPSNGDVAAVNAIYP